MLSLTPYSAGVRTSLMWWGGVKGTCAHANGARDALALRRACCRHLSTIAGPFILNKRLHELVKR